jgi:hypothetical protein
LIGTRGFTLNNCNNSDKIDDLLNGIVKRNIHIYGYQSSNSSTKNLSLDDLD